MLGVLASEEVTGADEEEVSDQVSDPLLVEESIIHLLPVRELQSVHNIHISLFSLLQSVNQYTLYNIPSETCTAIST